MFFIPNFPLPSNINRVISFRIPNVQDCMALADMDPELDEVATTAFLNQQQDKEKQSGIIYDSIEWTGEDRRTALWWIFLATHTDTTLSYKFNVNGQDRYIDVDLKGLGDTATTLSIDPKIAITFTASGTEYNAFVSPLNGRALEDIEVTYNQRKNHKSGSVEYRKLSNKIAIQEIVYSLQIIGEPSDQEQAEEWRYQLIMSLSLDTEFRGLVAAIVAAKRRLRHGLMTSYSDGVYLLITTAQLTEDEGEQPIMFPYQNRFFIPTF